MGIVDNKAIVEITYVVCDWRRIHGPRISVGWIVLLSRFVVLVVLIFVTIRNGTAIVHLQLVDQTLSLEASCISTISSQLFDPT